MSFVCRKAMLPPHLKVTFISNMIDQLHVSMSLHLSRSLDICVLKYFIFYFMFLNFSYRAKNLTFKPVLKMFMPSICLVN